MSLEKDSIEITEDSIRIRPVEPTITTSVTHWSDSNIKVTETDKEDEDIEVLVGKLSIVESADNSSDISFKSIIIDANINEQNQIQMSSTPLKPKEKTLKEENDGLKAGESPHVKKKPFKKHSYNRKKVKNKTARISEENGQGDNVLKQDKKEVDQINKIKNIHLNSSERGDSNNFANKLFNKDENKERKKKGKFFNRRQSEVPLQFRKQGNYKNNRIENEGSKEENVKKDRGFSPFSADSSKKKWKSDGSNNFIKSNHRKSNYNYQLSHSDNQHKQYYSEPRKTRVSSKVSLDNLDRLPSSFEAEDYNYFRAIPKSNQQYGNNPFNKEKDDINDHANNISAETPITDKQRNLISREQVTTDS